MKIEEIKAALLADQAFIESVAEAIWNMPVSSISECIAQIMTSHDVMPPIGWPDGLPGIMADTSSLPPDAMPEPIAKMIEGNSQ